MSPHKPAYANRFRISNYSDLFWEKMFTSAPVLVLYGNLTQPLPKRMW